MPRRKQRTPVLREHVLASALNTLAEAGIAGFTARRVAFDASTSVPAVYELFGDKAGLVRELFFDGWRQLRASFDQLPETEDRRGDLEAVIATFRRFVVDHPVLGEVMLSRPFGDFDPGPQEWAGGDAVREFIVDRVRRCVDAGLVHGNPTDIAHVLLGLAQGLAAQESAGWLGSSRASRDRRWSLAIRATLDGIST